MISVSNQTVSSPLSSTKRTQRGIKKKRAEKKERSPRSTDSKDEYKQKDTHTQPGDKTSRDQGILSSVSRGLDQTRIPTF
jgi:hypothetical protein